MSLRQRVDDFFTNWNEYEASVGKKLRLTFRNRLRALPPKRCCDHPGEPGC